MYPVHQESRNKTLNCVAYPIYNTNSSRSYFRIYRRRDDQPNIKGLTGNISRLEKQVSVLQDTILKLVSIHDPNSRFSNAPTLSMDSSNNSNSNLSEDDPTQSKEDFEDFNSSLDYTDNGGNPGGAGGGCSPSPQKMIIKRESQLSMASVSTLSRIREEEDH